MKQFNFILLLAASIYLTSCSNSPADKAQSLVKKYLKDHLKLPGEYEPVSFGPLDTLPKPYISEGKKEFLYAISHNYTIVNKDKEQVTMSVWFMLDKDLKVTEPVYKSINGDYGTLTGSAYWKYNNYVGDRADAGAAITLYSLDTLRGNLKYEATSDFQGNYHIDKIPPGAYFLIVRSKNATDCPEQHINNLKWDNAAIKQLFGFDLFQYQTQLDEIKRLDSIYTAILIDEDLEKYGGLGNQIRKYEAVEEEKRKLAEKLIKTFPDEFCRKIKLYTGYSNAYDFETLWIEEGETKNHNSDFGITCI